MPTPPLTSVSLLKDLSNDTNSVRWSEFLARYGELLRGYVQAKFPTLDCDDIVQETLIALAAALPHYRYTPDEKGHFRNYLIGIAHNKACRAHDLRKRENAKIEGFRLEAATASGPRGKCFSDWQEALYETALAQVMADPAIAPQTRNVFRHVALLHEPPEKVAADFNVSRNNVDQIKKRMIARLAALVRKLAAAG